MSVRILLGDVRDRLKELPDESVHCCVTSPPYFGLRDYGIAGQIGLEQTPKDFIDQLTDVFREVRRVLRADGTLWLNLGDSYAGSGKGGNPDRSAHCKQKSNSGSLSVRGRVQEFPGIKPKDLIGIPWMAAFALRADGWWLRRDNIWHKPNPMPESTTDRCTSAHEYIFHFSKSDRYYYDHEAIKEPSVTNDPRRPYGSKGAKEMDGRPPEQWHGGKVRAPANRKRGEFNAKPGTPEGREPFRKFTEFRNKRSVWTVTVKPFKGAHFATFPQDLIQPCILAGCPEGGTVLDPFFGAGTTGLVCQQLKRNCIGIELNPKYVVIAEKRLGLNEEMFS